MKLSKKKILLIDDVEQNDNPLYRVLINLGYRVSQVNDAEIAGHKLNEVSPDLVFCSDSLSGYTGFQVFNMLESTLHKIHVPFILVLSGLEKSTLLMGEELGIDGFLIPPFEPEEVSNIIAKQMQKYERKFSLEEKKFKTICKIVPYAIFVTENRKIVEANNKFYQLIDAESLGTKPLYLSDIFNFSSNKTEELKFVRFINGLTKLSCFNDIALVDRPDEKFHLYFSYIENSAPPIRMVGTAIPVELKKQATQIIKSLIPAKISGAGLNGKAGSLDKDVFTKREKQILELSATGIPIKHIADQLGISIRTVEKHRSNVIHKTKSGNIMEAVFLARKSHLLDVL